MDYGTKILNLMMAARTTLGRLIRLTVSPTYDASGYMYRASLEGLRIDSVSSSTVEGLYRKLCIMIKADIADKLRVTKTAVEDAAAQHIKLQVTLRSLQQLQALLD